LNEEARGRLILALDVGGEIGEALAWTERLKDHVGMIKIGKEAFTSFGPDIVRRVEEKGVKVFLDLKFHDIPNTVGMAAEAATKLGVSMFNVHALGGRKMMAAAVRSAGDAAQRFGLPMPVVLAVTVLTSLGDEEMEEVGFGESSALGAAVRLARLAKDSGVSGVVASPREVHAIRQACGKDFIIVTPGVRTDSRIAGDDQKRVLTPEEAVRAGSDFLVVGRPIMGASDPVAAAAGIVEAIAAGLAARTKS
jgi:orotidine-5'-phosphate decarboxylase